MQKFDCLKANCPLLGPHILEASAGTGKTFSIEHIFVRLILESIDVEEILVVTFTRAATRELKGRIRSNLEKVGRMLEEKNSSFEYLKLYFSDESFKTKIADALAAFDRCQIFTIHGFCYRMLKEFSFEAKVGSLTNPDEGQKFPKTLVQAAFDFLENGIEENLLSKEQVALLLRQFDSVEEIVKHLLHLEKMEKSSSFEEICLQCKAALHSWNLEEEKLIEDFNALKNNYKIGVKGDFEAQIKDLCSNLTFSSLFKEKGSIFEFISEANKKIKVVDPTFLHYPHFFDWGLKNLAPLFQTKVFPILQYRWNQVAEMVLKNEEYFSSDEIISKMKKCLERERFISSIHQKYRAVIIDEFQDTDAMQWDIFRKLFVERPIDAFYVVGDPKQSIYRFRNADVYTYLQAKEFLGERHLYHLDTNFRSSKKMIGALNALFSRNWLNLPKLKKSLPFYPVQAGALIDEIDDGKGAVHFFVSEGDPKELFLDPFIPFVVQEIERLKMKNMAILVKDRYQAEKVLQCLRHRGISAVAKSHTPLGDTPSFQAIVELFDAIFSLRDQNLVNIVMTGPFAREDLSTYKKILDEKGLVFLAQELALDEDGLQIFEALFAWELLEGFSIQGLKRKLSELRKLEADEGGRRRMEVDDEAVQIMTLHISKGLEFDVVFALGLISRTPTSDEVEELDAEKLRQQYVAMTRAKKRLYVPLVQCSKDPQSGTHSPLELFAKHFQGDFLGEIQKLSNLESITVENVSSPFILPPPVKIEKEETVLSLKPNPFTPCYLSSFTSLATESPSTSTFSRDRVAIDDGYTLQTMPRGIDTGVVIHKIFECYFRESSFNTQDLTFRKLRISSIVDREISFSQLKPWGEVIKEMVQNILSCPLITEGEFFTLLDISKPLVEVEFVYSTSTGYIKGFIDLVFFYKNKVYFVDWKTNWLESYDDQILQNEMHAHQYHLQSSIYQEALKRQFNMEFGGAYYIFVRGNTYAR